MVKWMFQRGLQFVFMSFLIIIFILNHKIKHLRYNGLKLKFLSDIRLKLYDDKLLPSIFSDQAWEIIYGYSEKPEPFFLITRNFSEALMA